MLAALVPSASASVNVTWPSCDGGLASLSFDPARWADERLRPARLSASTARRRVPELGAVRSLAQQLAQTVHATPRTQSPLSLARERAGRYAQRLARRRATAPPLPSQPKAAGGFTERELGMSLAEATGAREQMCRRHIVHEIGHGVSEALSDTVSTHFFGSIGGVLCRMMVRPIGAVFSVLLLLIFICFVAKDFIEKIGAWEVRARPPKALRVPIRILARPEWCAG